MLGDHRNTPTRSGGFRERGDRGTHFKTFVDAVFAFAVSMLAISKRHERPAAGRGRWCPAPTGAELAGPPGLC
jgi:hypothetical protein